MKMMPRVIVAFINYPQSWKLTNGAVIGDDYPSDVEFRMNENFSGFIGRNDYLHTTGQYIVVRQRVRNFLKLKKSLISSFSMWAIKDHRGKKVPEKYWLMNITKYVDCIDKKHSEFEWNTASEKEMAEISKLVIVPGATKRNQYFESKAFF